MVCNVAEQISGGYCKFKNMRCDGNCKFHENGEISITDESKICMFSRKESKNFKLSKSDIDQLLAGKIIMLNHGEVFIKYENMQSETKIDTDSSTNE